MPSQKSNSWLCSSQTTNIQMFYPLSATKVRSGVCQPLCTGMTHTISGLIRMHLTLNNFYSTDSLCGLGDLSVTKNQPTSGQLFKKQCLKTLRLGSCHPGLLFVSPAGQGWKSPLCSYLLQNKPQLPRLHIVCATWCMPGSWQPWCLTGQHRGRGPVSARWFHLPAELHLFQSTPRQTQFKPARHTI